jgi:predicted amidohydrolase YtcJ
MTRSRAPSLAAAIDHAIELATELHPDHWPSWMHAARRAYLDGDAWTREPTGHAYTNTLRLALASDPPKRARTPKPAHHVHAALEPLRAAFLES